MALYVENLVENPSSTLREGSPGESIRHQDAGTTSSREDAACKLQEAVSFVFVLLVPSFPKHLQVACHTVLQLHPIQHLCSSPVSTRVSPWPKEL